MVYLLNKNESLMAKEFFILGCMVISIHAQNQETSKTIVPVYKCSESKLPFGYELEARSFAFNEETVHLKVLNTAFPGCDRYGVQNEITDLWWGNMTEVEEDLGSSRTGAIEFIEINLTSISPKGVLNVQDHFYSPDEFCIDTIQKKTDTNPFPTLTFQYCPVNCSEPVTNSAKIKRPCIKKCCPVEKSLGVQAEAYTEDMPVPPSNFSLENATYDTMPEYTIAPTGCPPTNLTGGGSIWKGFFYDKDTWKRTSDSEMETNRVKPHFYRNVLNCNAKNLSQFFLYQRSFKASSEKQLTRLLTDGRILHISTHRKWEPFEDEEDYCIDGIQGHDKDEEYIFTGSEDNQVLGVCDGGDIDDVNEDLKAVSKLYMWSLFIASVFYIGTAIVYGILWDKQNTHGWTVFSLVTSLFFMCVFLGNAHRLGLDGDPELRKSGRCIANAILAHFFMIASFTWLSIISYDFWCTFKSMKPHNHNNKKLTKFFYYCIFGLGLPSIVVTVGLILEHVYPDRESLVVTPEYGDNLCFVARWSQGIYVYYIMAVLLSINILLTIMTFYKLYKFQKGTSGARSSSNAGDRKMMTVYLKLSVVLGTSWVFEFISWLSTEGDRQHWIWIVFDMYNLITAIMLFYIFVCKESTMTQLGEKYPCLTPLLDVFRRHGILTPSETSKPQSSTAGTGLNSSSGEYKMKTVGNNGIENKGYQTNY